MLVTVFDLNVLRMAKDGTLARNQERWVNGCDRQLSDRHAQAVEAALGRGWIELRERGADITFEGLMVLNRTLAAL